MANDSLEPAFLPSKLERLDRLEILLWLVATLWVVLR